MSNKSGIIKISVNFCFLAIFAAVLFFHAFSKAQASAPGPMKIYEIEVSPVDSKTVNEHNAANNFQMPAQQVDDQIQTVKAQDLAPEKNPKLSGKLNPALKIQNIQVIDDQEKKVLFLQGFAQSNQKVTLFIFSEDPMIMTAEADANGNWSYRLDKDLPDGQHEAFIALTDEAGNIISKGSPVAFVKTAQAATIIPVSALEENQAPMQKIYRQYVLIALVTVSICLLISLAIIGKLTYKRK